MSIASDDEAEELIWCSEVILGPMWKLGRDDGDENAATGDGAWRTGDSSSSEDRLRVNERLAVVGFGDRDGSSCGWQSNWSGDSCPVVIEDKMDSQ